MATDDQDTTAQQPEGKSDDKPPREDCRCGGTTGCGDCDPALLDDLTCRAAGVAAQAEYNAEAKTALDEARAAYPGVRTDYRTARHEAALAVQGLRHDVTQLLERVRCEIEQDRVIECLDDAFAEVVKKLKKCRGSWGCCSTDECDFDLSCPDTIDELLARKAEYEARLEAEQECFDRLAGEPAALSQRVEDARAEIEAAAEQLEGDQATVDLKRVYAELLVAQRHLQQIWGGFDCTQDFLDCLCHALTCWIKATEAVSVLTGHLAVKECRRDEAEKRCEELATNTVDEVLLEYERVCPKDTCADCKDKSDDDTCDDDDDDDHDDDSDDDSDDPYEPDDGDDHDDDCGCGNPHHHHRRRRSTRSRRRRPKREG